MAQSTLWILLDTLTTAEGGGEQLFNHVPGGCNVLFMDGHVEFIRHIPVSGLSGMTEAQAAAAMAGCTPPVLPTMASFIGGLMSQ